MLNVKSKKINLLNFIAIQMVFAIIYFLIGFVLGLGLMMDYIREHRLARVLIQCVIVLFIGLVLWPVLLVSMAWNTFVK